MARRAAKTQATPQCGFDFTVRMRVLSGDVVARIPEFGHVQLDRVAISFSQTRKRVLYGMQASLTPLRFQGGAPTGIVRGRRMSVQQVRDAAGNEMLYILTFYLPRFLDLPFREKLATVVHELWHISPKFDGDLRRHPGRCYAHGHSQAQYDAQVEALVSDYLATRPSQDLLAFLHCDFDQLQHRHGRVYGLRIPRPRLLPAKSQETATGHPHP